MFYNSKIDVFSGPACNSFMTLLEQEVCRDLDKDTVNWTENFDETLKEPSV